MEKKDYSVIAYVVIGIVVAFGINAGMAAALSTNYPIVAVESNSMVPTFARGDMLIIQGMPFDKLAKGDVIVFSVSGRAEPIVHRVLERNGDGTLQTKGDANGGQLNFEKSIKPEQVKGRMVLILPLLGWVKIWIEELVLPNALIVILAAVAITFIYMITTKRS